MDSLLSELDSVLGSVLLIANGFVKKSFEEVDANVELAIAEWNKHFEIEA